MTLPCAKIRSLNADLSPPNIHTTPYNIRKKMFGYTQIERYHLCLHLPSSCFLLQFDMTEVCDVYSALLRETFLICACYECSTRFLLGLGIEHSQWVDSLHSFCRSFIQLSNNVFRRYFVIFKDRYICCLLTFKVTSATLKRLVEFILLFSFRYIF